MSDDQTPVTTPKMRVAAVEVKLLGAPLGADLDPKKVDVSLKHVASGIGHLPVQTNATVGATVVARFLPLKSGEYRIHASARDNDGYLYLQQGSASFTTKKGQTDVRVDVIPVPEVIVEEGEWLGDHGKLTHNATVELLHKERGFIDSPLGTGNRVSLKPEFLKGDTSWRSASYSFGDTPGIRLKLRAKSREPIKLQSVELSGGEKFYQFSKKLTKVLLDGEELELEMTAQGSLPSVVKAHRGKLELSLQTEGESPRTTPTIHSTTVYGLFGVPGGQAEVHEKSGPGKLFPESGLVQAITPNRMSHAVSAAKEVTDERTAMANLFGFLKEKDIFYYGKFHYPELDDDDQDSCCFNPCPQDLHNYLWIALKEPQIGHCQDLAAAFRLFARILGIGGNMTVEQIFPWPQWNPGGEKREIGKDDPAEAKLTKFQAKNGKMVFVDGNGFINAFECRAFLGRGKQADPLSNRRIHH